ncbi:ADP-ribose glycohydrolase MACROD2-like [Thrips palmi]|uniref:ADP-ribose glycohydrolase MACROD2-like n=1 Tax=Thrips palmi TaxID=161013 RepID=A0A6P8ZJE6_THRPL|nr:ADP-ribose glycohydrolase MACROD2-like [Thrips palmi]
MTFSEEKAKYLSLPIDEKRLEYKCNKDFKTLSDIETWSTYFQNNESRLITQREACVQLPEKHSVQPSLTEKISLWKGDITTLEIDAIVNAANSSLLGGGGVDGAIHRAAGGSLKEECRTLKGCSVGQAKITGGYKLPAKYVIHTVGPQGEHPQDLKNCYESCLDLVRENRLKSVAFPCISTGVYGYPQEAAAKVALKTIRLFLEKNHSEIDRVIFCVFLPTDVTIYENFLQMFFPKS